MLTVCEALPAGRYGLMPVINTADEDVRYVSTDNYVVILEPINEIDGDPLDDNDEPEKIEINSNDHGRFTKVSNRGRTVEGLLLDVAISCHHEEDMESFPILSNVSFQTNLGALTGASDYVLVPVESDRTNPDPNAPEAHNWLVFDLAEETQIAVENGAIIIGDTIIDFIELMDRELP